MRKAGSFISHMDKYFSLPMLGAIVFAFPGGIFASSDIWNGTTNSSWDVGSNWSNSVVPTDIASFINNGAPTNITISNGYAINGFVYSPSAASFTLNFNGSAPTTTFTLQGSGVSDVSGNTQNLVLNQGIFSFINSASAGDLHITVNNNGVTPATQLSFANTATADNASITNDSIVDFSGMTADINVGALNSTATGTNLGGAVLGVFIGNHNVNLGATGSSNSITYAANAVGDHGNIVLKGGTLTYAGTISVATEVMSGSLTINGSLTNSLTIDNTGIAQASIGSTVSGPTTVNSGGIYNVQTNGSIGSVTNAGTTNISSTPVSPSFTNNGGLVFSGSGVASGITTIFNNAGGTIDISGITGTSFTLSNLSSPSAGNMSLGGKQLTLQSAALQISGVLADAGVSGGTGAKVIIPVGNNITFFGNNTYTGGTQIDGSLSIGTVGTPTGSIVGSTAVSGTGSFTVYSSGTIGTVNNAGATTILGSPISSSFINTGTLFFSGSGTANNLTSIDNQTGGVIDISAITPSSFTLSNLVSPSNGNILIGTKTLILNGSGLVLNGIINDSGAVSIPTGQTVTFTGNNLYTGGTNISGTLTLTGSVKGNTQVNAGGVYNVQTNGNMGAVTNAGTTTITSTPTSSGVINTGQLIFTGSGSPASITTIDNQTGGIIDISGITAPSFTMSNLVSPSGGGFKIGSKLLQFSNSVQINGVIAGSGGQLTTLAGTTIVLNNNNTYTGLTTVSGASELDIGTPTNANASVAGPITVDPGGTLNVYGSLSNTVNNGGTTAFFNTASGTLATINNTGLVDLSGMTTNIAIGSLLGSGNVTLTGAAFTTTLEGLNTTGTISGVISGAGKLTKTGTGTLTLSNANLYTGLTTVAQGTLNLTGSIGGSVQINSGTFLTGGGTVNGNAGINGTFNGPTVTGTANVGAGGLMLAGTINGLTTITNGGIVEGTSLLKGGANITNGIVQGNATVQGTTNVNFFGVVQGNASLTGTTNVNVGGVVQGNASLATTNVNAGGLVQGNVTISGTTTVAGTINGNGIVPLTVSGTTTVLSGGLITGNTNFTSVNPLTVQSGGTFAGNTTIAGDVNNSGLFLAVGSVGGTFTNNGVVSPAGPVAIGTIAVNNYTQNPSGVYAPSIHQAGSDLIAVTNTANLSGTLAVQPSGEPGTLNHLYTIVTANTINGTFDFVQPFVFFTQYVFYNPHSVQYELEYNAQALLGATKTRNQRSVATSLLISGGTQAITLAIESFTTDAQLDQFLDELAGSIYASQQLALIQIGQQFTDQIADRIDSTSLCFLKDKRYQYRKSENKIHACERQTWWTNLYIGNDDFKGSENANGVKANIFGVVLGVDRPITENTLLGATLAYADLRDNTTGDVTSNGEGDIYQGAVYGRYQINGWKFGGAIGYGYVNDLAVQRDIFNGFTTVQTSGDYKANVFLSQARMSYDFIFPRALVDVAPLAGIVYQRLNTDDFHENTNTGFELNIYNNNYRSLRTQLGAEVGTEWSYYDFSPLLMLAWEHEFDDEIGAFNASFVGTSTVFPITGAPLGRNVLLIRAGAMLAKQYNWDVSILYEGRFADAFRENFLEVEVGFF